MAYRKLSRTSGSRRSLLRNQVTSFLREERIETTRAKADAIRPLAEKMITLAKKGGLHERRQVAAYIYDEDVVTKLFKIIAPRMETREGGYTRIMEIGERRGDGAPVVIIELVK